MKTILYLQLDLYQNIYANDYTNIFTFIAFYYTQTKKHDL